MRILAIITALLAIAFVVTLIVALVKDRKKLLRVAIVLFIVTGFLGGTIVYKGMNKVVAGFPAFEPRSGEEIYAQSITSSHLDCVKIINTLDRTDLFRSCCVWLEFETCPAEINRFLELRKHTIIKLDKNKVLGLTPETPEKPAWWRPDMLGDSALVISINFPVPGMEQKIFLSADTTKAFYFERMNTVFQRDSTNN